MGRRPKIRIKVNQENETPELETKTEQEQTASEANTLNDSESNGESKSNGIEKNSERFETDLTEIDNIIKQQKENKEEKRGRKSKDEKAKATLKIPGTLFVRMHNYLGSGAIGIIDGYITKDNPVPRELVSMDEKMIEELAPLAEMAMQQMKLEENPIAAFYISFGSIMVANYMSVKQLIKQAMKQNPNFNVDDLTKKK